MGKKPKEPSKTDYAIKAACKDLYFKFTSMRKIREKTGYDGPDLARWIYGEGGHQALDRNSWYYERDQATEGEFLEVMARNKFQGLLLTSQAIDDCAKSMKALRERKGEDGKFLPLQPHEMRAMTNVMMNIQRLNQAMQILHPIEFDKTGVGAFDGSDRPEEPAVIDMEAVAFAMQNDKGILKLLQKRGFNDTDFEHDSGLKTVGGSSSEADPPSEDQMGLEEDSSGGRAAHSEFNEDDESSGSDDSELSGSGEKTGSTARKSKGNDSKTSARGAHRNPARKSQKVSGTSSSNSSSSNSRKLSTATGRVTSTGNHQGLDPEDRDARSDDHGPSERGGEYIGDPFEDEYS